MSNEQRETEESSSAPAESARSSDQSGRSIVVDQVFSMFKDYQETKLEDKGKQIEQKSKIDEEVVPLKYKSNQKQLQLNVRLDSILESIEIERECGEPNLENVKKVSQEGMQLIHKRQKLIKIADKRQRRRARGSRV